MAKSKNGMKVRIITLAVASLLTLAPARAQPPLPVTVITSTAYTFMPGDQDYPELRLQVVEGGRLEFAHLDPLGAHNIIADDTGPDGRPLFETDTIGMGQTATVERVASLQRGTYTFHCQVHYPIMLGRLDIVG